MNNRGDAICIIGAGPAGLAMARAAQQQNLDYDQFDANEDVGGLWDIDFAGSAMYESAHFISSKTMSGFSSFPMPDSYPDYPSHRQILAFLRAFADEFDLRSKIAFNTHISNMEKTADDRWNITLDTGEVRQYRAVICNTGQQWQPRMPEFEGSFNGEIRHSASYRSGDEFVGKRVLIVGAGNSGCDIACDAASRAKEAAISVRRGYHFIPKHIFGQPSDVFADGATWIPLWVTRPIFSVMLRLLTGDLTRLGLPKPDHKLFESHPLLNSQLLHYLQHGDLTAKADIEKLDGDDVVFKDGTRQAFDLILCATGFHQKQSYANGYFQYKGGRPSMYLQVFSREHRNLMSLSFIETNSGAYRLFDILAQTTASYLAGQLKGSDCADRMDKMIHSDTPDLSGGIRFLDTPRHAGYADSDALKAYIAKLNRKLGWQLETG
jgi:Flavin-binding monooxygenase-like